MSSSDNSLPHGGPTLKTALWQLVKTLDGRSIPYAVIGGIATIQHARVRTTNDVDVVLNVSQVDIPALFEALQAAGFTTDVRSNTTELRDDGMTTVRFGDVLVDLLRPVLPVFAHAIDRAVPTDLSGQLVRICSAECLIVTKLIAFRPQDQADVKDLLAAYGDQLDVGFVRAEFATVADSDDPRWATPEEWVRETRTHFDSSRRSGSART